jgi:hypothetical protein
VSVFQELEDRGVRCCFVAEDGTRCDQAPTHGTPRVTACELHAPALGPTPVVSPDPSDADRQATATDLTPPELTPG